MELKETSSNLGRILDFDEIISLFNCKLIPLKGESDKNRVIKPPEKRYSEAKKPLETGWNSPDYKGISSDEAWALDVIQGGWIGMLIPSGYIVVDIDDKAEAELLNGVLKEQGLKYHYIITPHGGQFIFRDTGRVERQNVKAFTPLGFLADYRLPNKGYIVLPSATTIGRYWETVSDEALSPLPSWLEILSTKKEERPFELPIAEGARNDTLFRHASRLQQYGYPDDEIYKIIEMMNAYLVSPPLGDREIQTLIRSALRYEKGSSSIITPVEYFDEETLAVPFKEEKVEPFPEVFPEPLQRFIKEASKSLYCPPDFLGVPMLSIAGSLIGNSAYIKPKDDWKEYARIWSLIIGKPGDKKTPALKLLMEPIFSIQERLKMRYEFEKAQYEEELQRHAEDKKQPKPIPPIMRQIYTTDATIESLAELLKINNNGLLIYQDEAAGWVLSMNQYKGGKGSDKQQALSLWSGTSLMVNRKGREPLYITNPFVGFTGGIQPQTLGQLRSEMSETDGFIHRFIFAFPEPVKQDITLDVVSIETKQAWDNACKKLNERGLEGQIELNLTKDALDTWMEWMRGNINEQEADDFPEHLLGPWAKFGSYSLRISMVLHLLRYVTGEVNNKENVDYETMIRTIKLMQYLKSHARKVYSMLRETPEDKKIRLAIKWIEKHGGEVSYRDLVRNNVAGIKKTNEAVLLVNELIQRGHAIDVKDGRSQKIKLVKGG